MSTVRKPGPNPEAYTTLGVTVETRNLVLERQRQTGEKLYRLVDRLLRVALEIEEGKVQVR